MWNTRREDEATTTLLQAQAMPTPERHQTLLRKHRLHEKAVEQNRGHGHTLVAHGVLTTGAYRNG